MRYRNWLVAAALGLVPLGTAAAQATAQANDAAVTYLPADRVQAAFAKGMPMIEVGDYKIHASRRETPGMAEIHTRDTDIAYIIQGSATLVTGGAIKTGVIVADHIAAAAITASDSRAP